MNMAKKGSAPGQSHITTVVLCTPDTQKQSVQMPNTARATDLMNLISAFPAAENNPENPFPPKFHLSHESSSKSFLSHITHSWRVPVQAKRLVDHPFDFFMNGRQEKSPHHTRQRQTESCCWRKNLR